MKRSWALERKKVCQAEETACTKAWRREDHGELKEANFGRKGVVACYKIGQPGKKSSVVQGCPGSTLPHTPLFACGYRRAEKAASSDPAPATPHRWWPQKQGPQPEVAEHPLTWERMQFGAGGIGRLGGGLLDDSFLSIWDPAPGEILGALVRCADNGSGGDPPCR